MTKKSETLNNMKVSGNIYSPPPFLYMRLPEDLQTSVARWIEEGNAYDLPGFMVACLQNNLMDAVARADNANFQRLPDIMRWIYCNAPIDCWGSKEKFENWRSA